MDGMLTTLFGGSALIIVLFGLLYWRRADPRVAALAAVFFVGVAYTASSLMNWQGIDHYAIHVAIFVMTGFILAVVGLQRASGRANRLHWGPLVIVGFFVFLISALSAFVHIASNGLSPSMAAWLLPEPRSGETVVSTTFPGTVDRRYQEEDQEYNRHLSEVREQAERGWDVRQGFESAPMVGEPVSFLVEVVDRDGEPVRGALVTGAFERPASEQDDIPFTLDEADRGRYTTELALPQPGRWNLVMTIERDGEQHRVHAETTVDPS